MCAYPEYHFGSLVLVYIWRFVENVFNKIRFKYIQRTINDMTFTMANDEKQNNVPDG